MDIYDQIVRALTAADKGLDPVRTGLGMDPYYPQEQPQHPMPTPQMNPNRIGMQDIRENQYDINENDRAAAAQQEMDARYGMIRDLDRQASAMRIASFDEQNAPQGRFAGTTSDDIAAVLPQYVQRPKGMYEGTTSDEVAEALPQQAPEYQIQSGDTLSGIASKMGVSLDQLIALNQIKDPNRIYAGDTLKLA